MTRKKVKLAWIENDNSRAMSLKKKNLALLKKMRELTILCDVRASVIIFSPNEIEPMVWPSVEAARGLLDDFFALPDYEKMKKETNLQSYMKEKTRLVYEKLMKNQNKNMECITDQVMVKLYHGYRISDLSLDEIYALQSYSKVRIMLFRKMLDSVQHPTLRDSPVPPLEAQFKEFMKITNDIFAGGGHNYERARKTDKEARRIDINTSRENKSHYLMDLWICPSEPAKPRIHQQMGTEMVSCNENANSRNHFLYQGSSSNQGIAFHGFGGSVSQPLQHFNMENNPSMGISQARPYLFDFMSHDIDVRDEGINIYNGDSQYHRSITIESNNNLRQEPPPSGTTVGEDNVDATAFDINRV